MDPSHVGGFVLGCFFQVLSLCIHLSTKAAKRVLVWIGWFGLGFFMVVFGVFLVRFVFRVFLSLDDTKLLKF